MLWIKILLKLWSSETYTEEKLFHYDLCIKMMNYDLKSYMWLYTGEKKFHCMFVLPNFFKMKMSYANTHRREKFSVCDLWSKFFECQDLKMHISTHTGEKSFCCVFAAFMQLFTVKLCSYTHWRKTHPVWGMWSNIFW